jgi:uncharacterized protein
MIPQFPKFKPIELSDRKEIELITSQFAPYSDFNFTSLYCWDVGSQRRISILNTNLVVLFTDYISGIPTLSFVGVSRVEDTVSTLLAYASQENFKSYLKYIPEMCAGGISSKEFIVLQDRDNFDYLYHTNTFLSYQNSKRKLCVFFEKNYSDYYFGELNCYDTGIQSAVLEVFNRRAEKSGFFSSQEYDATKKMLNMPFHDSLYVLGLFLQEKLVAFNIVELLHSGYAMSHFKKADVHFTGIYPFFNSMIANWLVGRGVTNINFQQDLGIPELRSAKLGYKPVSFLKKYTVAVSL